MYLVFDIGGTKIRMGVTSGDEVKDSVILEESQDFAQAMEKIRSALPGLVKGEKIEAAAAGVPGVLNEAKTKLFKAPNLPGWDDKALKDSLQEIIGAPVFLENDAGLNGLGEAHYGAGKGFKVAGFLTISTGVGGTRIVNGQIDKTAWGFEPGKMIVNEKFNTLEDLISGKALEEKYGKAAEKIEDEEVWDGVAKLLAVGLNNAAVFWGADVIVLGGSVIKSIPLDKTIKYLREILTIFPDIPEIKEARLGELSGLYGGLALLNQKSR